MRIRGRIERFIFESSLLRDNPLGDPAAREVIVYLPPGYDQSKEPLPLVLMLPGYAGSPSGIVSYDPFKKNTVELLDEQIVRGESPPFILALPDCMTRFGGSQFIDSIAHGPYQSYLADEIIPAIDARYRTIAEAKGRAMVGRSSGGFGALRMALDRPGVVSIIASHAGDALFEVTMRPMFTGAAVAIARAGGLKEFADRLLESGPKDGLDFDGAFIFAAAQSYSPNLDAPAPHVDLPVDIETGALIPGVFERWLEHDPVRLIAERAEALRSLRYAYLDAGDGDEHGLNFGARALKRGLEGAGVMVDYEEFPGGHRGTSWRYGLSLPLVARKLRDA